MMNELEQELTARIKEGDDFVNAERYEEALAAYEQTLQLDTKNPLAYLKKSAVLRKLERYQEALDICLQAITLDLENAGTYQQKGEILLDLKQYEEALTAFEQAIHMNSNLAGAYYGKGNALRSLNGYDEALVAYDRAILLNPTNAGADAIPNVGSSAFFVLSSSLSKKRWCWIGSPSRLLSSAFSRLASRARKVRMNPIVV
jgi:tetratricopeptide (TPR) repeat protein